MPTIIAISENGTEEFADTSEQCFEKLASFLVDDYAFITNTMKRFSEELIIRVLQSKSSSPLNIRFLYRELKPVGLLHNVGNYFHIVHLVNHMDHVIERMFNASKQRLCTVKGLEEVMYAMKKQYFCCSGHSVKEDCLISGNSTLMHNFLRYLAFSVRLAGLALISGMADALVLATVDMATTIELIHPRLTSVGGWMEVKRICENFEVNPRSVDSVKFVKCSTIPNDH